MVHCIGHPHDPNFVNLVNREVERISDKARNNLRLTGKLAKNQRGDYVAVTVGYSHGGGQVRLQKLCRNFIFTDF